MSPSSCGFLFWAARGNEHFTFLLNFSYRIHNFSKFNRVIKNPIYAGEPNVGHFINFQKGLLDSVADFGARNFGLAKVE